MSIEALAKEEGRGGVSADDRSKELEVKTLFHLLILFVKVFEKI